MRILSLNGGGTVIYLHAKILSLFEKETGRFIYNRFDRIHGVSAGAILGGLLATGHTATFVSAVAKDLCKEVFGKRTVMSYMPWNPKYDERKLEKIYNRYFSERCFKDCEIDFSCHAVDISGDRIKPKFWKSWDSRDSGTKLKDAIRASSAAPTFFAPKTIDGTTYVDGAMVTNNPSMCALVDALGSDAILPEIYMLNLQSGTLHGYEKAKHKDSIVDWVSDIYQVGLYGVDRMVEYQCHELLGFRNHVILPDTNLPLDSCDFDTMDKMAADLYAKHREALIKALE